VGAANVGVTAASQRLAHAKDETNLANTIAGYMVKTRCCMMRTKGLVNQLMDAKRQPD
jgi:hypothetical protein